MLRTAGKGAKIAAKEVPKAIKGAEKAGSKAVKKAAPKAVTKADDVIKAAKKAVIKKGETVKDAAVKGGKKIETAVKSKVDESKTVVGNVHKGVNKVSKATGEFYIDDWTRYPEGLPKPNGPFKILEGEEYNNARNLANKINANIHKNRPDLKGTQIHEVHPVKFGGSPTDIDNKIALSPKEHAKYTTYWNRVLRNGKNGGK